MILFGSLLFQKKSNNHLIFCLPESITYFILGIVREVSATLVATTHNRYPSGGCLNTFPCSAGGSIEYKGKTHRGLSLYASPSEANAVHSKNN